MKVKENKSEKIRDYLKSVKPSERSPKAVSEALKAKGTIVTPTLVSLVKMKMGGKRKKARKPDRVAQIARKSASTRNNFGWTDDVIRAKDFISSTGGVKQAKKLLDVVAHLIS
jgi:peptidoglycan hydrolase-like amidase